MLELNTKKLYIYLVFLYVANLSAISANYVLFMLPEGMALLGASSAFIGITVAAPRLVLIVVGCFLRDSSIKINEQKMSLIAAIIGIIIFIVLALSSSLGLMLLFSFLYGYTYTVGITYMVAMAIRYIPQEKRMSLMGLFTTSASLGISIGPVITSLFEPLGEKLGYANFIMIGGALLCLTWAIFTTLAKITSSSLTRYDLVGVVGDGDEFIAKKKIGLKPYSAFIPLAVIFGILFATIMSFTPAYASDYHIPNIHFFFLGFGIMALLERLFLFRKMAVWKKRYIIYAGFTTYFIGFALMSFVYLFEKNPAAGSFIVLLAGIFVGSGHGVLYPTFTVLFTDLTPNHISTATFTYVISFMAAAVLGYPLGLLADFIGYPSMFKFVWVILFGVSLYYLFNSNTRAGFKKIEVKKT